MRDDLRFKFWNTLQKSDPNKSYFFTNLDK